MAPYDTYDYQAYWVGRDLEDQCERVALGRLFATIPFRGSIVDVGGGFGRLSDCYAPLFLKSLVIDPSGKLVAEGQKRHQKTKGLSFAVGSLPRLPLQDQEFEVALLIRVSHHLHDLNPSLKELSRVLKQDGFLILEVANKIHFLARVRAWAKGDFSFTTNLESVERRSQENIKENKINFSNHHPQKVMTDLRANGFSVISLVSVSNFRSPLLKKTVPQKFLLLAERLLQVPLGKLFFGPSIFILARKT